MKTYHDGANAERTAILAKVRRIIKSGTDTCWKRMVCELEGWIEKRVKRYRARKGGL